MTAFTEKLDRAAGAALCEGVKELGSGLINASAVSLVFGGPFAVPFALGTAALMVAAGGCTWDPDGPAPVPTGPPQQICYKGASNFTIRVLTNGVFVGGSTPDLAEITRIAYDSTQQCQTGGSRDFYNIYWKNPDGTPGVTALQWGGPCGGDTYTWIQVWDGNDMCSDPGPEPQPIIPPYTYTDPDDGCTLIVNWEGFSTDGAGHFNPVFKIEPGENSLRTEGGGIIGGCNFEPVIYTGNPGGPGEPPFVGPWDPTWDGDDENPWAEFLREIAAGVLGAGLADVLAALLEEPYAGTTYRLVSVCETDASGEPISEAVEETIPTLPINDAILTRLDALVPLLQGQKDFKQPVCSPEPLKGEFRTIAFRSEQISPAGKSCLRKRLRYRSVSGIGLDGLIDHWKDFVWSAGPVTVKHRGSSWGTITVWAASVDEGKRVIRHAAAEAGVDADQTGRWEISGSSSTRLGMPGTMKVDTTGGYYWITDRDGSNNRPIVGKT